MSKWDSFTPLGNFVDSEITVTHCGDYFQTQLARLSKDKNQAESFKTKLIKQQAIHTKLLAKKRELDIIVENSKKPDRQSPDYAKVIIQLRLVNELLHV